MSIIVSPWYHKLRTLLFEIQDAVTQRRLYFLAALGDEVATQHDPAALRGAVEELDTLQEALERIDRRLEIYYTKRGD